ncbi:MAG: spermidine/putrescine ABC transporter substrate-binding protein [Candidatus Limiplasma sp.]|nr:spermidine/putrescine ABC transporter substrate-binding protein [Candidatus Limiplasma sp.]
MKKLTALLLSLLMLLPALSLAEGSKVLNLFTWETYIDDDIIAAFEQETGIDVIYSPAETNDDMMLKMGQTGGEGYDLVLASDYALNIMQKEGLLQKLDKGKLPNYGNLDEAFLGQYYDPNNEYVIPYMAGTPLIVYDPAQVSIEITGYEDLWNPALEDSIVMIDDARNVIGITLKTMGKSFNETDPEVLAQAKEKLMPLFPNIRVFDYNTPYLSIINGEVSVAYMFTPQVYYTLQERPDLKVVYPKEGLGFGIDGIVLSAKSANVDNAHLFLDYLMRPDVAAHNALTQTYMNVNKAAAADLPEEYLNSPVVYVPADLLTGAEFIQDIGEAETTMQEIYTAFKLQ